MKDAQGRRKGKRKEAERGTPMSLLQSGETHACGHNNAYDRAHVERSLPSREKEGNGRAFKQPRKKKERGIGATPSLTSTHFLSRRAGANANQARVFEGPTATDAGQGKKRTKKNTDISKRGGQTPRG